MERSCLDCGNLIKGRADKKFCDDGCRNNYNNRHNSENTQVVKKINLILKKNRAILANFNPEGKAKILKKKLVNAGFNFEYYTHTYQTQNASNYIFCYEYGYLALANDEFLLVKREA